MKRKIAVALIAVALSSPLVSYARDSGASVTAAPGASAGGVFLDTTSPTTEQIQKAKKFLQWQTPEQLVKEAVETPESAPAKFVPTQAKEEISAFEAYVKGKLPLTISTDLKQFGYDLFRKPPATFTPVNEIPVGSDYILGPGDEIMISVWGKVNARYSSFIDRDGKIVLPQLGPIYLTGLTFSEAKKSLGKEFTRLYKRSEVKTNVSMGRLRSIRVFVVGKATRPGSYVISSFSTLINALFASGGPSKIGTMRNIQIRRNGNTIVHFDMYDFLLKGDKTKDIRLMPEDVIFLPPAGPLVAIAGNVKAPAIYELKGETKLLDLINMAGGLTNTAFNGRVQVQRVKEHKFTIKFERDLIDMEEQSEKNFSLNDGDLVKIFSVTETATTVKITGAVAAPGEYGITHGVTKISDIIPLTGGLLHYASNKAELTRVKATPSGPQTDIFDIDISKAMEKDPEHDLPLEVNDYLFIHTVPEWGLYRMVAITGEVRFPGRYTVKKGETLFSLIERAGGYTDKAYLKGAVFVRESVRELQQKRLDESIDRLEHQIISRSAATIGAALEPGAAQQEEAVMGQRKALVGKMRAARAKGRISIKLSALDKLEGSPSNLVMEEWDQLYIPERPQQVNVIGAVYNQTAFIYNPKSSVSSYVDKAGGVTDNADKSEMYILKVDGTAVSKRARRGLMSMKLDPGDTVVVPEEIDKIAWMREIKDVTQILYQIAVSAGVFMVLL